MTSISQLYRSARVFLLVALAAVLAGAPVQAQSRPILVAVPDEFPPIDARAAVLRSGDRDMVLLPPDGVTVDALAGSLIALRHARGRNPTPKTGEMIPVTGFAALESRDTDELRELERLLDRLERQPTTTVGDLGSGRWVRYRPR